MRKSHEEEERLLKQRVAGRKEGRKAEVEKVREKGLKGRTSEEEGRKEERMVRKASRVRLWVKEGKKEGRNYENETDDSERLKGG